MFDEAEGDAPEFGVVEYGRAAGEAAADDDALAVPSAGFEAAVRTLEVVELTGRVTVPAGADPAEARAPAPGCAAAAVDPPTSLAARSAAAPAASPRKQLATLTLTPPRRWEPCLWRTVPLMSQPERLASATVARVIH